MSVENLDYKGFRNEVINLCEEYGISISHEDGHGAFLLTPYDEHYTEWFRG